MKKKKRMKCKWHNNSLSHQKLRDFNLSKFLLFIWKPLQPLAFEINRSLHHLFLKYFLSCNKAPRSCWNGHYMKKIYCYHFSKLKNSNTMNFCGSCILQLLQQLFSASPPHTGTTIVARAVFPFIGCPGLSSSSCFHHTRYSPKSFPERISFSNEFWQN